MMEAMVFRHFEACLLAFGLISIWTARMLRTEKPPLWIRQHGWFLCGLVANTLGGLLAYEQAPAESWNWIMMATYLGAAACYAGWINALLRHSVDPSLEPIDPLVHA